MKKMILVLFTFVLSAHTMTARVSNFDKVKEELREEIEVLLDDPNFMGDEEMVTAQVQFLVNYKGEIVVIAVNTEDEGISDFIKYRLNYQKVTGDIEKYANRNFMISVKVMEG